MTTILLPFHDDAAAEAAMSAAHQIVSRFGGHIEGLLVRRTQQIIAAEGFVLPPESLTQLTESEETLKAHAARFESFMKTSGVPMRDITDTSEPATADWREVDGIESQIVGDYGRLFDLIVIGRALDQPTGGWLATCEAGLFESGRAVLLVSAQVPAKIGERVLIAWNGSTETARTIALAMRLLREASAVEVLTVTGGTVPGPSGRQMANHLVRNGISADARTVELAGRSVGEAIVEEARDFGADLLIKGAYTQNRLRQMIFGGATRHILQSADMPVLLAH